MSRWPFPLLLLTVSLTPAPAQASDPAAESPGVEVLAWLTGCWASHEGGRLSEECWLHPAGGMMLGVNRTVSGEKAAFEFLRIAQHGDGLAYLASPGGHREPTPFALVEHADGRAIFANPEHDFPQRLTYELGDDGVLVVTVEAQSDGEWRGFQLVWERSGLAGVAAVRSP